VGQAKKMLIES